MFWYLNRYKNQAGNMNVGKILVDGGCAQVEQ